MIINKVDSSNEGIGALQKPLFRLLKKLQKKKEKQEEELRETGRALWYREMADSLLSNPSRVPRGVSSVTIQNIHTQMDETVSLNPKFDCRGNTELLYKKARKAERGGAINQEKVRETQNLILSIEEVVRSCEKALQQSSTEQGKDITALIEQIKRLLAEHAPEMKPQGQQDYGPAGKAILFRHFSIGTWDLYIGKNDSQNDELTTRFARLNDVWLHVAGHAGSHVVIRRPDKTTVVPTDVLATAASLAVWFSRAKHTSYAEVHYTEARFVHKRRHSPPGEVMLDRYKSIRVAPRSPQEIFASRYER
jgi:predicted ribosome quality control (RQC) complex YloA/Tae2 family protein